MNNQPQAQTSNNDSWFNLDFTSMLQSCGCLARDTATKLESRSQSSNMSRRKLVQNDEGGYEYESLSHASQDWVDLDFEGLNQDGRATYHTNNPHTFDDFETKNPIDFDYLMTITGVNEDDAGSQNSGLSKGSKKIAKMAKRDPSAKGARTASPEKGGAKPRGKRNPWQPHEDAKLLELVAKHGQSWALIATLMEGRSGKQVRDRYTNILRPNIKKGDWTPQEDQQILSLFYDFGAKWSKISSFVPGRTEGQVKNRFYAHIKKKLMGDNADNSSPPSNRNPVYLQSLGTPSTPSGGYSTALPTQTADHYQQINFQPINQNVYQAYPPHSPSTSHNSNNSNDIANSMISYENGDRVPRNGSNEVFLEPSTNANSPNQQTGKGMRDEKEIDYILDRMAMFFEKNHSLVSVPSQDQDNGNSATAKMERVEQLKKRRQALEYLLSQTDRQINTF